MPSPEAFENIDAQLEQKTAPKLPSIKEIEDEVAGLLDGIES